MFGLGTTELILILVIVLIFFGTGKLKNVMGELGTGVKSFKKAMSEADEPPPAKDPPVIEGESSKEKPGA